MKIVFVGLENGAKEKMQEAFSSDELIFVDELKLESDFESIKDCDVLSVFVNHEVRSDLIDKFSNLKLIATRSTGFDHVDVAYAKGKNIQVANVPTYGSNTVAEFTFALMLATIRRVPDANNRLRKDDKTDVKDFEGVNLYSKTIGVIGSGNIGKNVIKIAKGFSMKVLAYDTFPKDDLAKELGFEYVSLYDLLKNSDIVTIHVPYIKETHHLINEEKINLMKPTAYLINTARGEIVDTKALVNALLDKKIKGAGLDVLEGERLLREELDLLLDNINDIDQFKTLFANHRLIDMENVVVTPHIAFNTIEAKNEIIDITISNIKKFIETAESDNQVKI